QLYYALTSRRCLTATFIQRDRDNRDLHSFPTRRSSDLSLQRLNTTNKDYKDLKFKPNSVIYCDPPYKNTEDYGVKFNHDEFYERSEEHTSELQSRFDLVCRLLLEKKNSSGLCRRVACCV